PVLPAAGQEVQAPAGAPQERSSVQQDPELTFRQEIMLDELLETFDAEMPARDPADRLDVAQAPGAAFDVRLEVVRGIVKVTVPRLLLFDLCPIERGRVP